MIPSRDALCRGQNCGCKWQCNRFLQYALGLVCVAEKDVANNFTGSAYPNSCHADCIYYLSPYTEEKK